MVIGFPVANRNHPLLSTLVGYFVNTVALRISFTGEGDIPTMVKAVTGATISALKHATIPFPAVVAALPALKKQSVRAQIYQTMVMWHEPVPELQLSGLTLSNIHGNQQPACPIELTLKGQQRGGNISGSIQYDETIYSSSMINRLALGFEVLLKQSTSVNCIQQASHLMPAVTFSESEQLDRWTASAQPYQINATVPKHFSIVSRTLPINLAIQFDGEAVSYCILSDRAQHLAATASLRCNNVGGCVVGLCCEKSVEEVVGMLGIMFSGAAWLPLDSKLPADRLQYIMTQCTNLVVVQDRFKQLIQSLDMTIRTESIVSQQNFEVNQANLAPNNPRLGELAYVLFTSGSTGRSGTSALCLMFY